MSNEIDDLHDKISGELDKRKMKRLVDDGLISLDDIANAPIYILTANCKCNDEPDANNRCRKCLTKYTSELSDE